MILIKIDRSSSTPLYKQIINRIVELIENGSLEPGSPLPSTRLFAERLGISREVTYRAFDELQALGYLESRQGSYTTVRQRLRKVSIESFSEGSKIDWEAISNPSSRVLHESMKDFVLSYDTPNSDGFINLSQLHLDPRLFPIQEFRRCIKEVLQDDSINVLNYGDPQGSQPLREHITQRARIHGIAVSHDEILLTNGAQHSIELVLHLLSNNGSKIFLEEPTYGNAIPLFKSFGFELVGIPMRNDGIDLNVLERRLKSEKPAFIYTMPSCHNPCGITTSQQHREQLLLLAEQHKVPIVEDGFDEEMKYFGEFVLPLKSMDIHKTVIYIGTYSKVLFPGIRLGGIVAAKDCIQRLLSIKKTTQLCGNTLIEAAMECFYRYGYYNKHIKRMRHVYRKRMQTALNALKAYMPNKISWTEPAGGHTIWLTLSSEYKNLSEFKDLLYKYKILVSPGNYFFFSSSPNKYLRISIANSNEQEIQEGIKRLGKVIRELNLRKA